MTEAQAAWLRRLPLNLADLENGIIPREADECLGAGWSDWSGKLSDPEIITPAGLAALAAHEARP